MQSAGVIGLRAARNHTPAHIEKFIDTTIDAAAAKGQCYVSFDMSKEAYNDNKDLFLSYRNYGFSVIEQDSKLDEERWSCPLGWRRVIISWRNAMADAYHYFQFGEL